MAVGDKVLLLRNICFYFMVAGFTYFSLLPEVDKVLGLAGDMKCEQGNTIPTVTSVNPFTG